MVGAETFVSVGLNAISATLILVLIALGLVVIFGFMGVINLAHGAFFTVGTYVIWFVSTELGLGFWLGLVLAPLVTGFIGYLVEVLIISRLYHRLLDTILATWGVAIVIRETIKLLFGATSKTVDNPIPETLDLGIVSYPSYRIFLMGFTLALLVAIFALFDRTQFGIRMRAVIQDSRAASLMGINQERMYQLAFSSGAALAGLAGACMTPLVSVDPSTGLSFLVQSFLAVILGGTGSLLGVLPGSVVVAGSTNVLTFVIQPVAAQTLAFVVAIVIIALRPEGILNRSQS
ncbi:branched-chain amino acid ABC transporter permease [Haloplanus rallus]|jgi:branched-chain amino acid transport system permease protein/urea transport system permease protein|uniref:Branched-chain amino acid ABC transporter permease n=1 Tax=Haloplanus rallus TaxID=1816183 RepID=A0A6B9F860_9EURY|nr:branched-chain amino acid ABC transporter permease [Haloplanus rallus]QGX94557.1 branched-chain amino acid ABC transporter permease [Haloplanus rallus]